MFCPAGDEDWLSISSDWANKIFQMYFNYANLNDSVQNVFSSFVRNKDLIS